MKSLVLLFAVIGACYTLTAQSPAGSSIVIVRLDTALDEIIAPEAKVELLKGDYFGFLEGPVWVSDDAGYLLFSDVAANAIGTMLTG